MKIKSQFMLPFFLSLLFSSLLAGCASQMVMHDVVREEAGIFSDQQSQVLDYLECVDDRESMTCLDYSDLTRTHRFYEALSNLSRIVPDNRSFHLTKRLFEPLSPLGRCNSGVIQVLEDALDNDACKLMGSTVHRTRYITRPKLHSLEKQYENGSFPACPRGVLPASPSKEMISKLAEPRCLMLRAASSFSKKEQDILNIWLKDLAYEEALPVATISWTWRCTNKKSGAIVEAEVFETSADGESAVYDLKILGYAPSSKFGIQRCQAK